MLLLRFLSVAAASVSLAVSAASAAPRFDAGAAAGIDRAVQAQISSGQIVGVSVAVIQDGQTVFQKGYGKANLEWDLPVTPETVFRIASNTKTFTAASVLILADQGKLSVDDKLSRFVPDFPRSDEITLRQLMTHTSGLATYDEYYSGGKALKVQNTNQEMIDLIKKIDPLYVFEPGAAYKYSNSNYYLLGEVVERVSGKTLNAFMTENIFNKLGMTRTSMDVVEDIVPLRAAGYNRVPGRPGQFTNVDYIPYTTPGPAGGLRSTAGELARWHMALFGGQLVSAPLIAEMVKPARTSDGRLTSVANWAPAGQPTPRVMPFEYGFGIRVQEIQGHRTYWHSGAIEGFTSQVRTYPNDGVTIAMTGNTFRGFDGLVEAVEAAVLGLPQTAPGK